MIPLKVIYGWLHLAPFLGSSLGDRADQEVLVPGDTQHDTFDDFYVGKPHHPHYDVQPDFGSKGSIYDILSNDDRFTLITKAVNFVEDIAELLNDSSAQLTFFAPPDKVLRRPHHPPKENISSGNFNTLVNGDLVTLISQYRDLSDLVPILEEVDLFNAGRVASYDDDDDDDDEKRKKIFKIILRALLSYHILPDSAYDVAGLLRNGTYATKLQIHDAFDGEPLRLRVHRNLIPPDVYVNFFTRVDHGDVKASNGVIHVVNHPLLPPPSIFQELFWVPEAFSTFTSGLQRSNLTGQVDLRYVRGSGLVGTSLATVFAPTNRAFARLPKKLQLFLFSPFGERCLKALLEYHIVPNTVIYSNYIHGDLASDEVVTDEHDFDHPPHESHARPKIPRPSPIFSVNLTANTLFENHTVNTFIAQEEVSFPTIPGHKRPTFIDTRIVVNGRPAVLIDVPSLNGAVHIVDRVLDPRGRGHGDHHHKHHKKHRKHHKHHKHEVEHAISHAHYHGLALFGGLNGAGVEAEQPSCPCAKGKRSGKCRHAGKEGEATRCPHFSKSTEEVHHKHSEKHDDPWADWEEWLPQWAEQKLKSQD